MSETRLQSLAAAAPPHPRSGRALAAMVIVFGEGATLLLFGGATLLAGAQPVTGVLMVVGSGVLFAGFLRMRRDSPAQRADAAAAGRVPWDWTDFVMFWPGLFIASSVIASLALPAVDATLTGSDHTVRTAVESFVEQSAFYAGALFNIYVLAGLRRGAVLADVGWRRFSWWWLPAAMAVAAVTYYVAGILQELSQRLLPSAHNTQCVAVQHEYGHFVVLAVIVVCVIAPLSEETIFRGFVYGWLRRRLPVVLALPASAAIFAALHGVLLLFIPLFVVGAVLALMYQLSKSLWPGALVHALFNLPGIIFILSSASC